MALLLSKTDLHSKVDRAIIDPDGPAERESSNYPQQPQAEEPFGELLWSGSAANHKDSFNSQLLRGCREIMVIWERCQNGIMIVQRHSIIKGPNHIHFSLISRVLDRESYCEGSRLLMISIEEKSPANFNPQRLMDKFHLSKSKIDADTSFFWIEEYTNCAYVVNQLRNRQKVALKNILENRDQQ